MSNGTNNDPSNFGNVTIDELHLVEKLNDEDYFPISQDETTVRVELGKVKDYIGDHAISEANKYTNKRFKEITQPEPPTSTSEYDTFMPWRPEPLPNTNLNFVRAPGFYRVIVNIINGPVTVGNNSNGAATLLVMPVNDSRIVQTYYHNDGRIWNRTLQGTFWSAWQQLATMAALNREIEKMNRRKVFMHNGRFIAPCDVSVIFITAAGGGGGGARNGGGGGGGACIYKEIYEAPTEEEIEIIIGIGGAGGGPGNNWNGRNGTETRISGFVTLIGGTGGQSGSSGTSGQSGGGGGGGGRTPGSGGGVGVGSGGSGGIGGGGGGGGGHNGGNGISGGVGGPGGTGNPASGALGGGGGGGGRIGDGGSGGAWGGGGGGSCGVGGNGANGNNTHGGWGRFGGGGGGGSGNLNGGHGGRGIVIIEW